MSTDSSSPPQDAPSAAQPSATASPDKPALFVAHALVLAVQDATDNLRHTTIVSHAAVGAALSRFIATGDDKHLQAIEPAQRTVADATNSLGSLAAQAAGVLRSLATDAAAKSSGEPAP